jgi:hypothetical protein
LNFCSRVSLAAHEQMAGTGVRGQAYVFLPVPKRLWHEQEMNSHWASEEELQAIRLARKSGVVTRLYNPPAGQGAQPAPMLMYDPGGEAHEGLQRLLARFAGRWPLDAERRPRVAICVHGTRDRCCAKFGFAAFQTARRLHEAGASIFEPVECSHLGGDRFAATGVFFPSGSMYAHLDLDIAAICAAECQGRLSPANYRGGVFDAPAVQLARTALAREGLVDEAAAPLAVTERGLLELEAEVAGRRYRIRLKLAQVEFFGSCAAMTAGRPSRAKRAVVDGAELLAG